MKTTLEMFKEIEDLDMPDGVGITVKDIVPFMCKKVELAIQRLEVIDNSNPSEALECLEEMWELSCDSRKPEYTLYDTIKQALLKAQEQNHYLKWEDLEFKEVGQKQIIKVKKNDNLYILKYYISVFDEELIEILANDWTFITGLSNRKYDKQFFNDLHLEVEE